MESKLLPCKCGGTALYGTDRKCSEGDRMLIEIFCFNCGKNVWSSVRIMQGASQRKASWTKLEKKWNERMCADDHK